MAGILQPCRPLSCITELKDDYVILESAADFSGKEELSALRSVTIFSQKNKNKKKSPL